MPFDILLADDSVPAQNMGKKILVEAGYHVLTVSNGLEALRKMADAVPDIAILDIFMPGYTGLELCERLRASTATATLPVILTVGRLEPYRPEDGEHVHANAVLVKPFAAAELIAAVRSLIGAPSAEAADADPAPAVEGRAADEGADPLQEFSFAPVGMAIADSLTLNSASTPEQFPEILHAEVPDDRLLSYGEFANPEDTAPWASQEPGADGSELLLSTADLNPNSLVFNPDAGATPFSASVIDLLPSESHLAAGDTASEFTEFELEPAASHDPFAPGLGIAATKTNSFAAAAAAGHVGPAAVTALTAFTPQVLVPEPAIAPEDAIAGWFAPGELESPTLNAPALNSWLEVQHPVSADVPVPSTLGESAEEIISQVASPSAVRAVDNSNSYAVQPVEDEDARTLAFEALFNSTEPFAEEESYAGSAEVSSAKLPNLADRSKDESGDVSPFYEVASLIEESDHEFVAPELDPYLMQDERMGGAALRISERDSLLDDAFEPEWSGMENAHAQATTQAATANTNESDSPIGGYSPLPVELGQFTPTSLLATELAATQLAVEALPEAREALDESVQPALARPAEIGEPVFAPASAQQIVPESVYLEAQQDATEPMYSESNVAEPAPVQEPEPQPTPVQEPEPQPTPVPEPEPAPVLPASVATEIFDSNVDTEDISSSIAVPPQAGEAERIQQAVDRVFDRFKRLLVRAIVRELARHD